MKEVWPLAFRCWIRLCLWMSKGASRWVGRYLLPVYLIMYCTNCTQCSNRQLWTNRRRLCTHTTYGGYHKVETQMSKRKLSTNEGGLIYGTDTEG